MQQPSYNIDISTYINQLKSLPPIVSINEINTLKNNLKLVAQGKLFILQGGDCAERFIDCNYDIIKSKLNILLAMCILFY